MREKIWLALKYVLSVDYMLLKNCFLDNVVLNIISCCCFSACENGNGSNINEKNVVIDYLKIVTQK
jgi:hypothetical protein